MRQSLYIPFRTNAVLYKQKDQSVNVAGIHLVL